MIKKFLFPAAGYGTRFLPATKSTPKEIHALFNSNTHGKLLKGYL